MNHEQRERRDAVLCGAGMLGVAGNVVAVVLLRDQPQAYRLAGLDAWARQIATHPRAAAASAAAFSIGLLGLALFALELRHHLRTRAARSGALLAALGAAGNAFGTLTPLVLALHVGAQDGDAGRLVSRALLGMTLSLDALFNFALGVGLLAIATGLPGRTSLRLRALGVAAGVSSIPVSAQCVLDGAASLLSLAGPLWLAFICVLSLRRWSFDASHAR